MWLPYAAECRQLDRVHSLVGCVVLLVPLIAAAAGFAASSFACDWGAGALVPFVHQQAACLLNGPAGGALTVIGRWRAFQLGDPRPKVISHRISPRLSSSTLIPLPRPMRVSSWATGPASATNAGRDARRVRAIATGGTVIRLRTFPFDTGSVEDRQMSQVIRGDRDLDAVPRDAAPFNRSPAAGRTGGAA
jgi:hypothetical protein